MHAHGHRIVPSTVVLYRPVTPPKHSFSTLNHQTRGGPRSLGGVSGTPLLKFRAFWRSRWSPAPRGDPPHRLGAPPRAVVAIPFHFHPSSARVPPRILPFHPLGLPQLRPCVFAVSFH